MANNILFLLLLLLPLFSSAQRPLVDSVQLLRDMQVIAADSMEGRRSGTAGNLKAQRYLENRFRQIGLIPFKGIYRKHFQIVSEKVEIEQATNLVGYIPGRSAKAIVMTAHYDHLGRRGRKIFNGADDNASGVAAMLAAAAYFSENKPYYTLIFAALDGEELGLQGAKAFLKAPPVPLQHIVLNVNLDMLGISNKGELYASGTYHYPWLKPYLQQVAPLPHATLQLGHDRPEQDRHDWTDQSDHFVFHKHNIPFVYFGVEDHAQYHQPTDIYQHINQPFFIDATALVINVLRRLNANPVPSENLAD